MKRLLCVATVSLVLAHATASRAEDAAPSEAAEAPEAPSGTPEATTKVRVASDWEDSVLIQHLGTSFGTGVVNGRAASVTTLHLAEMCRVPCTANVPTEGRYYVDAPGMNAREFRVPVGAKSVDVDVRGVSQAPLTLSAFATILGGAATLVGAPLWAALPDESGVTDTMRTVTIAGVAVLAAGIVGLVVLPRTQVELTEPGRGDARAVMKPRASSVRFTGSGVVF